MKRIGCLLFCILYTAFNLAVAQRPTDQLDRGLVVIPTGSSGNSTTNVITWRRLAGEYYDVKYNVYKDGTRVATNLDATCYADNNRGYSTTQYAVAPVVRGVEQERCAPVTAWTQYVYKLVERCSTGYLDIVLANVYDRDGNDVTDYPLPRLESGETSEKSAWGDDYGHRSSKYFMGAPFLDGRQASLFLARGIYTRHKMIAMDLNVGSHTWSERWRWNCNSSGSAWYGNGYHNFIVADVDEDGCDEIVYGSMVIADVTAAVNKILNK